MKHRWWIAILLGAVGWAVAAEPVSPPRSIEQIRKEMSAVRRTTDWGNAAAAEAANARIAQLAEEMIRAGRQARPEATATTAAAPSGGDTADPNAEGLDPAKLARQFTMQAAGAVAGGKNADVLLATSVREEIAGKYEADVDPAIKCPEVFAAQTVLVIDFSSPAAEAVVRQMENFRGITTLVLTGGPHGAPVDLPAVLKKARLYPLRELYVVGFGSFVAELPPELAAFADLRLLAVYRNHLTALPDGIGGLRNLETLYVDLNPLPTVLPTVRTLPQLRTLGLGRTDVPAAEQAEIRRLLPHCEILLR